MDIQTAKQIRLEEYLHSLGYSPVKRQGINLWYKSPFREETEASFKVNTERNQWYDFALGKGGNIIALASHLYATDSVPYLLKRIEEQAPHVRPVSFSFRKQSFTEPSFQQLEIVPLSSPALLAYLQERGINPALAKRECKEARFTHNGKRYFAIAFPNISGGYEIRNRYFKGCIAPKDITHIRQQELKNTCFVFEGFMDYLSFLTLKRNPNPPHNIVVLNSVTNLAKAVPFIASHERVYTYLDNDEAGRKATAELKAACRNLSDQSVHYRPHNDLNDYLRSCRPVKEHRRSCGRKL